MSHILLISYLSFVDCVTKHQLSSSLGLLSTFFELYTEIKKIRLHE